MYRHKIEKTKAYLKVYICIKCNSAWCIEHCVYGHVMAPEIRMGGIYVPTNETSKFLEQSSNLSNFEMNKLLHGKDCLISDEEYRLKELLK